MDSETATTARPDNVSLRELAESFARFRIDQPEANGPVNYLITRLTVDQAQRLGATVGELGNTSVDVVLPNLTGGKDAFCKAVGRRIWEVGAVELCFLSDAWISVRDTEADFDGVIPSQDPERRNAWIGVYLSRLGPHDAMMIEYAGRRIKNHMKWGDPSVETFSGRMLDLLQSSFLDAMLGSIQSKYVGGRTRSKGH